MSRIARNFREEKTFLYTTGAMKEFEPAAHKNTTVTLQSNPDVAVYSAEDRMRIDNNKARIFRENTAFQQCCNILTCGALLGGLSLLGRK